MLLRQEKEVWKAWEVHILDLHVCRTSYQRNLLWVSRGCQVCQRKRLTSQARKRHINSWKCSYIPRNPEKIKDTKKWLKSDLRGPGERHSKVKWPKSDLLLSHSWVTFKELLSHFHRDPESHFWVSCLCLSIFRGFGVCRSTSGWQTWTFNT